MTKVLQPYSVSLFFILTFAISWAFWSLPWLYQQGWINQLPNWWGLGSFGPSLAGIIIIGLLYGSSGLKRLFKRLIQFKASFKLYLVVAFLPIGILITTLALGKLLFNAQYDWSLLPTVSGFSLLFIQVLILGGPMNEELGWRGFALPKLQQSTSALTASLWIGSVWAIWHLPLFMADIPGYTLMPFYLYWLNTLALAIIFTWLYNTGKGQLWLSVLLHTFFNTINWLMLPLLPISIGSKIAVIYVATMLLVAIFIIIKFGKNSLSNQIKSVEI